MLLEQVNINKYSRNAGITRIMIINSMNYYHNFTFLVYIHRTIFIVLHSNIYSLALNKSTDN